VPVMNPMKETENRTPNLKVTALALAGMARTSQLKQETTGLIQKRVTAKKTRMGL